MKKIIYFIGAFAMLMMGCSDSDVFQDEILFKNANLKGISTQCYPDIEGLVSGLPGTINVTTTAKPGTDSYFTITINGTDDLAGEGIPAWCIDVDRSLDVNHTFDADVYSSSESLPDVFENPDNFDLINWIINEDFIGTASPSGGVYTFGDVQWAIWELIDNANCSSCSFLGVDWSVDKGKEIYDAALTAFPREEVERYVPDCGQLIAIVLIPQDNSQPIFITMEVPCECEPIDCNDCDGKVTRLDMTYNGGSSAEITVMDKKGENQIFNGTIAPGESFTINGFDKNGTLGTEIVLYVDGVENTKIHTSCSQPIGPGLSFGDFTIIGGASRNGGELCPLDPPPGGGDDCNDCDGKVTRLDMTYNGGSSAEITVMDKKGENEIFNGTVTPGESFTINGFDKNGTLGTEIVLYVDGVENTKIHTSCSQPIGPGLSFGDFTIIGGASRNGGELCPLDPPPGGGDDCNDCDGKVTRLDMTYNGGSSAEITVMDKKGENQIFNGTIAPGESFTINGFDKNGTLGTEIVLYVDGVENTKIHTSCSQPIGPGLSFGDFTIIGGASRNGGELCPLDPPPGGGDDCNDCDGKVTRLDMTYNGGSSAEITVMDKKGENEIFNGIVTPGESFTINGFDKNGTLGTEIVLYVDGVENTKIHTSCSQPIGPGLSFGDFTIIGGASRNGGELCQ